MTTTTTNPSVKCESITNAFLLVVRRIRGHFHGRTVRGFLLRTFPLVREIIGTNVLSFATRPQTRTLTEREQKRGERRHAFLSNATACQSSAAQIHNLFRISRPSSKADDVQRAEVRLSIAMQWVICRWMQRWKSFPVNLRRRVDVELQRDREYPRFDRRVGVCHNVIDRSLVHVADPAPFSERL